MIKKKERNWQKVDMGLLKKDLFGIFLRRDIISLIKGESGSNVYYKLLKQELDKYTSTKIKESEKYEIICKILKSK